MVSLGNFTYISPASGAGGPGFKSPRARHTDMLLLKVSFLALGDDVA